MGDEVSGASGPCAMLAAVLCLTPHTPGPTAHLLPRHAHHPTLLIPQPTCCHSVRWSSPFSSFMNAATLALSNILTPGTTGSR